MTSGCSISKIQARFFSAFYQWSFGIRHPKLPCHTLRSFRHRNFTSSAARLDGAPFRPLDNNKGASTGPNTAIARVQLEPGQVELLERRDGLVEICRMAACEANWRDMEDGNVVLQMEGESKNVRVGMEYLSRLLGTEGILEKKSGKLGVDPFLDLDGTSIPPADSMQNIDTDQSEPALEHMEFVLGPTVRAQQTRPEPTYELTQIKRIITVPAALAELFPYESVATQSQRSLGHGASVSRVMSRGNGNTSPYSAQVRVLGKPIFVDMMCDRLRSLRVSDRRSHQVSLHPSAEPSLAQPFRHLMRSVVNPVAVATSYHNPRDNTPFPSMAGCRGSTISSLSSVTVEPAPIISFNLLTDGETAQKAIRSNLCTVHILADNDHGRDLASRFAKTAAAALDTFDDLALSTQHSVKLEDDRSVSLSGPGVLATLKCRLLQDKTVEIGDHSVIFWEVVKIVQDGETSASPDHTPKPTCLAYAAQQYGRFHHLSETSGNVKTAQHEVIEQPEAESQVTTTDETSTFTPRSDSSLDTEGMEQSAQEDTKPATLQNVLPDTSQPVQRPEAPKTSRKNHEETRTEAEILLDRIMMEEEQAFLRDRGVKKTRKARTLSSQSSTRSYSTSTTFAQRRPYSTSSATPKATTTTTTTTASQDREDPAFLKQTVREFLGLDTIPKGRWVNNRWIRELQNYGPDRVQIAIKGVSADAPDDGSPGGRKNGKDMRIRKLIEHLHRAQRMDHVSDEVMEELVLGKGRGDP
ncbi:hypothetical protein CAC42_1152 [Sphaceloma murrayae]|uniref:Flavin reductase like domain-containing protein n=1 Tax=Sphaceloma murrayae TaxID=2082308 RepID=A0A2K1R2G3_9PEZI|nr:hypothetical protein CAC42_1152 [Sphaceloma murrayae]